MVLTIEGRRTRRWANGSLAGNSAVPVVVVVNARDAAQDEFGAEYHGQAVRVAQARARKPSGCMGALPGEMFIANRTVDHQDGGFPVRTLR